MERNFISIKGARVHNLKNIDIDIPRNKFVVITGVSGSGKSSLAFDTIYAEAERRFVESISSYARQFLGLREKPDVDEIKGLSPAIVIDQRSLQKNPRSTVGTTTEIYDHLRILFTRIGAVSCPDCGQKVKKQNIDEIIKQVMKLQQGSFILVLAPVVRDRRGQHKKTLEEIARMGYLRVRLDHGVMRIEEALDLVLDPKKSHSIEVVVDRLIIDSQTERARLKESFETAFLVGKGLAKIVLESEHGNKINKKNPEEIIFSQNFACENCHISIPPVEPRLFSFNSPHGACPRCTGLGIVLEVDPDLVVINKNLTLEEGVIRPWARVLGRAGKDSQYWTLLKNLSYKYRFSLSIPFKDLPKKAVDIIMNGEPIKEGDELQNQTRFEGVIEDLKKRWRETDSEWTRGEMERYMREEVCPDCNGKRLRKEALGVTLNKKSIVDVSQISAEDTIVFLKDFLKKTSKQNKKIANPLIKEITRRLQFLVDVGLGYLALDRSSVTLAGGEAQRVRLATQIGSDLSGVIYVLDEPSAGLHPRDHSQLIETLKNLRDKDNTVVVVEHDRETIENADWIIDLGPGAGRHGGEIIFEGEFKDLKKTKTLTGEYISGKQKVEVVGRVLKDNKTKYLKIIGVKENNLKNINIKLPLGRFVCVAGVSGSGKSSLVNDVLARALMRHFYNAKKEPGEHSKIEGIKNIDKVVVVTQDPIGKTPRSNPATYTGAFSFIRELFAGTREAKNRGYKTGYFSFNVKGGRCEECEGQGVKKIEMYFLPDLYVPCEDCEGRRYSREILSIYYNNKNISDILDMTIEEALAFFKKAPQIENRLNTLHKVGLGYMKLGQPATTLSGGEAQRIKLATELSKKDTGKTLYILDEPTTGLHFDDIKKLLAVLRALVDKGNTVLVVEHNLDVIKNSDWVIDLGPEGGGGGGKIIAEGLPKEISKNKDSYTGQWLRK